MAVLTTLLLTIHLLAMDVASAGPLVCIWLHERGRRGDATARRVGRQMAVASLAAFVFGIVLGMILLALAWAADDQGYWNAVRRFPAREYWFVAGELAFSLVCLVVYVGTWNRWQHRPWLHGLVAVLTATNLLYHFPPLMTILGELATRPALVAQPVITRGVFQPLMARPDVLSHVVHFIVASMAVAGAALMYVARRDRQRGRQGDRETRRQGDRKTGRRGDKETRRQGDRERGRQGDGEIGRLMMAGAWIALAASIAQLGTGLWVLMELPPGARSGLVGGDWWSAALLFLALVAVFGLLHALAAVALGDTRAAVVRRGIALLVFVALLMTAMLGRTRQLDRSDWSLSNVDGWPKGDRHILLR